MVLREDLDGLDDRRGLPPGGCGCVDTVRSVFAEVFAEAEGEDRFSSERFARLEMPQDVFGEGFEYSRNKLLTTSRSALGTGSPSLMNE